MSPVEIGLHAGSTLVALVALTLAFSNARARAACEQKIKYLQNEVEQLTTRLLKYAACPCPRLVQVENLALATLDAKQEADRRLGRVLLQALDEAQHLEEDNGKKKS